MDCADARIHVSALHDGQPIPTDAAEHIQACETCQGVLRDYDGIGAEIRSLASELEARNERKEVRSPSSVDPRSAMTRVLSAPVRVPGFLIAVGIALILGLTAGLVFLEAQGKNSDLWFSCELDWPQAEYKGPIHPTNLPQVGMGFGPLTKSVGPRPFFITGPDQDVGTVAGLMEMQHIQPDLVRFTLRVKHFAAKDKTLEEIERTASPSLQAQKLGRILADAPTQQYNYKPGTTLKISAGHGESLNFTGQTGQKFSGFTWQQFPLQPGPEQLVLDQPALVPEAALLVKLRGTTKISGPNGCAYIYVPEKGLLILALHRFPGAHEAAVNGAHALFELDHKWYYVFSELPIIGGRRPKTIWVYLARHYEPSLTGLEWDDTVPFVGSADDVTQVLEKLKK